MKVVSLEDYAVVSGGKSVLSSCEGICNVSKGGVVTVTVTGNNKFHLDNYVDGHLVQGVFSANQVQDLNGNSYDVSNNFILYGHTVSPTPISGGHNYDIHF